MSKRSLWDRLWRRLDRWVRGWMADEWDDYAPDVPRTLDERRRNHV